MYVTRDVTKFNKLPIAELIVITMLNKVTSFGFSVLDFLIKFYQFIIKEA